jgi:hypothetical protein
MAGARHGSIVGMDATIGFGLSSFLSGTYPTACGRAGWPDRWAVLRPPPRVRATPPSRSAGVRVKAWTVDSGCAATIRYYAYPLPR